MQRREKLSGNSRIKLFFFEGNTENFLKGEKITSAQICKKITANVTVKVTVGVKKICKTAWLCGSEANTPTFASSLEAEKKAVEASYFEISELRNSAFFEASVYRNAGYRKKFYLN